MICLLAKSLYRSRAGGHFYGIENEIWSSCWTVVSTEKKWEADYEKLMRAVFSCSQGQKKLKY